jgi:glucokinase
MKGATAIGFDVGGTNIRAALVSERGEILAWKVQQTENQPEFVVEQITKLVRSLNDGNVKAIGIGLPGRIDVQNDLILSGGYVDLTGVPLATTLRSSFDVSVTLDNDCNMALVGEQAVGHACGIANVMMFTIGTGIGGAVFSNGRIFRGRATAGQLGHLTVDVNGEVCLCGRRGCIETTSSGTALGRHIATAGLASDTTVEELFTRSSKGDAIASGVLALWVNPLRAAIDSAVAAFDPELVLLGGGLGIAAHRALAQFPAPSTWYQCPVEPAELGDRAGVIGAGLSALAKIAP